MMKENINEYIKKLDGISYPEWKKLRYLIDSTFDMKKGKLEKNLKLSLSDANSEDAKFIHSPLV